MANSQFFDAPSGLAGGAILRFAITEVSQDSGLNQSTDQWSLTLFKGAYASFAASVTYSGEVNGVPYSGNFAFDFRVSSSQLIASGTATITHNADGTKSIGVYGDIGSTGTSTGGPALAQGVFTQTPFGSSIPNDVVVSRLSHTLTQPFEHLALADTEAEVLQAIQATAAEITLDTLPADLSTAPVIFTPGGSALDGFNAVLLTEQGTIYSSTSGSLLAPVEKLVVRERTRPEGVASSWDVELDLDGAPEFVRDLTNMYSTVRVAGPSETTTVTDVSLVPRVGSANTSETILNTEFVDILAWGQDRLQRGANVQLRLASVTIDAMTTSTDRTADLLALKPGDRHQFTNLPATQLGFSTWDGWLLGVTEQQTLTAHTFTLYFQPVLPAVGIYDTSLWMADGDLALTSSISAVATTMNVETSNATVFLESTTFPYTIIVGDEQMTVTGCTTAAPQVATVTRGANGTTATTHAGLFTNLHRNPKANAAGMASAEWSGTATTGSGFETAVGSDWFAWQSSSSLVAVRRMFEATKRIPAAQNDVFYCRVTVRNKAAASRDFQPSLRSYSNAPTSASITQLTSYTAASQTIAAGATVTFTFTVTVTDATVQSVGMVVSRLAGGGAASADQVGITDITIAREPIPDGDTVTGSNTETGRTFAWLGTTFDSSSTRSGDRIEAYPDSLYAF